jgi:flagellar biosynthetic protein FliQ
MTADRALSLLDQMLWNAALLSAPILLTILVIGVLISVIQVATQIQEMTLTYVPKLIVTALLLVFLGSWMVAHLT